LFNEEQDKYEANDKKAAETNKNGLNLNSKED
jgi:hypothetical protein